MLGDLQLQVRALLIWREVDDCFREAWAGIPIHRFDMMSCPFQSANQIVDIATSVDRAARTFERMFI